MVKGISKQVIVVHSPDKKLFDQAIFILKDGAVGDEGVTDDALLKEANMLLKRSGSPGHRTVSKMYLAWACMGAAIMGAVWLLTALI